jgi:hypothetical protein
MFFLLDEIERPLSRNSSPKSNVHIIIDPTSKKLNIPAVCKKQKKNILFSKFIRFL